VRLERVYAASELRIINLFGYETGTNPAFA